MNEKYDRATAIHYSAYCPPLHDLILKYVLLENEIFSVGLDVGCGTGYSAIALTEYCSQVHGIEPSNSMLLEAIQDKKITYHQGSGEAIPLSNSTVDLVTFAGSLFYAKSLALIQELKRVCRSQAIVVAYDFEVLLDDILVQCDIDLEKLLSSYNHQVNFSNNSDFSEIVVDRQQVEFEATASELAHIMLSSSYNYDAFVQKFGSLDTFSILINELNKIQKQYDLKANIYFSKYQIK